MKNKFLKVIKRPFIRNVVILSSGTAGAQIINLLLAPLITRLYGPEAYGLMGTFLAIVSIVTPVAALTYPFAIVLPKHDSEARSIVRLSLLITIIIAMISIIFLMLFYEPIIKLLHLESIGLYMFLIPMVLLSAGVLQIIEQWLIRTKQFGISAQVTFYQSILINGGKVGVGLFYPAASVLILFSAFKQTLKFLMVYLFIQKNENERLKPSQSDIRIPLKKLARKYNDFPIFRSPQTLIYALTQSLPILLLTSFFGPVSAGYYSLGKAVMGAPTQLIGKSVGDVFYPRISEAEIRGENLSNLILKATISLALIGIIPFGIIMLFGPRIFSLIFGAEWFPAGEYARWIALYVLFNLIHQPSVKALPVLSAQGFHLAFTILTLVVNVCALALGYYIFESDILAVAFFGASSAVLSVILILITLKISRKINKNKSE